MLCQHGSAQIMYDFLYPYVAEYFSIDSVNFKYNAQKCLYVYVNINKFKLNSKVWIQITLSQPFDHQSHS